MKIATYNVNGINGRLPVLRRWLAEAQPDIVCLQELKAPDERFPAAAVEDAGYEAIWHGQKSWNGVAILSRVGTPIETRRELPGDPDDPHSRYIEAAVNGVLITGLYLPNGNPRPGPKFDYKLRWFGRLIAHAAELIATGMPVVLAGDFNVIPTGRDVYKPERWVDDALFAPEVRAAFERLVAQGWTDALRALHPDGIIYTFWDYFRNAYPRNAGLRIDHLLLSPAIAPRLAAADVDRDVRGWEKTSDHAPVWIELADRPRSSADGQVTGYSARSWVGPKAYMGLERLTLPATIVLACAMAPRFARLFAGRALIWLCAAAASPLHAGAVALTFDDLPVFGRYATAAEGRTITMTLLDGLRRHRWVATGFVNEIQLQGPDQPDRVALLNDWLDAGMDLGNHTYSHLSLTTTPVDAYIADIEKGATLTSPLLAARKHRERWFRYPYLETGVSADARRTVQAWLSDHGYRVAPVTMENSDWQFAAPYDDALARGDAEGAARIRRRYLDFTGRITIWYEAAARQLLGRQPAFVFLLHASRLNAASIDDLAELLRRARLRVVTLDQAMRDPAYTIADTYVGPDGIEWLERWSLTLHRDLPFERMPQVPADIVAADAALEAESDPHTAAAR